MNWKVSALYYVHLIESFLLSVFIILYIGQMAGELESVRLILCPPYREIFINFFLLFYIQGVKQWSSPPLDHKPDISTNIFLSYHVQNLISDLWKQTIRLYLKPFGIYLSFSKPWCCQISGIMCDSCIIILTTIFHIKIFSLLSDAPIAI